MSSWISVKDKLPDCGSVVLCFFDFNVQSVMEVNSDGRFKHSMHNHDLWSESVTHWMELPPPPEEV